MSSQSVIRLFGKLPAHGDFVSRGIPPSERDMLDAWLSDEMRDARGRFGEEFEERFDTAPPWLFAHDDEGGVLCPSVDSAGRRFPLLVGRTVAATKDAAAVASACAETVYEALACGLNADQFVSEAACAVPPLDAVEAKGWWPQEAPESADYFGQRTPPGILSRMLDWAPA